MSKTNKVFDQIIKLSLDKDVETQAIKIYENFPANIKAWRPINNKVYLCVTEAYRYLGIIFNTDNIQTELKITNNKKKNIIKNAAREGYQLVLHKYSPHDFVEKCCGYMGIRAEKFADVRSYIDILLKHDPVLEEKSPESVTAGVIAYYAKINGYTFEKNEYCKSVRKSLNDISVIEKKMSLAYNDVDEE